MADSIEAHLATVTANFTEELKQIRAGRPSPEMFENIQAEAYGSPMKLSGLANINIVDATLVTIQAWDKTVIPSIMKALQTSEQHYNPQLSGDLIRLPLSPMTEDKRKELVKFLHEEAEKFKIQIRMVRKDAMEKISEEKKVGLLTEDTFKVAEKKIQDQIDTANTAIDSAVSAKENQLLTV